MKDLRFSVKQFSNGVAELECHNPHIIKTKMDAIDASIKKWETITQFIEAEGIVPDEMGTITCGLCIKYKACDCNGCPIADDGHQGCRYTPYEYYEAYRDDNDADVEEALEAARAEVVYLKDIKRRVENNEL